MITTSTRFLYFYQKRRNKKGRDKEVTGNSMLEVELWTKQAGTVNLCRETNTVPSFFLIRS